MMSVPAIVEHLDSAGVPVEQIDDFDAIAKRVAGEAGEGDVVLVMSSGAFGGVHEKILKELKGER
jgi:UDP-N-acetylmuramate: L-alanyl-gamma-D-glutamyl-meso-diaminopimelate ligase